MDTYAVYPCYKCKDPFIGGLISCEADLDQANNEANFKAEEYICEKCGGLPGCKKGGDEHKAHLIYKCRFCCQQAVFFCMGYIHFCDPCHNRQIHEGVYHQKPERWTKCPGPEECPLAAKHPPPGETHVIGCLKCWEEEEAARKKF